MGKGELHVELAVNYADGSLAAVSRGARLLYVDALCLCKRTLNDGVLSLPQLLKLAYPDSKNAATKQVRELTEGKDPPLADNGDGTYTVTAWLKRNKSRAELQERWDHEAAENARKGALGNHKRWHVNQGVVDPSCEHCPSPDPPPLSPDDRRDVANGSPAAIPPDPRRIATETETETETETRVKNGTRASRATRLPPGFALDAGLLEIAARHGMPPDVAEREFEGFTNWHAAKGNTFVDWRRAWGTWVMRWAEKRQQVTVPDREW